MTSKYLIKKRRDCYHIYRRWWIFSWRTRWTGPFGSNHGWACTENAEAKIRCLESGEC